MQHAKFKIFLEKLFVCLQNITFGSQNFYLYDTKTYLRRMEVDENEILILKYSYTVMEVDFNIYLHWFIAVPAIFCMDPGLHRTSGSW